MELDEKDQLEQARLKAIEGQMKSRATSHFAFQKMGLDTVSSHAKTPKPDAAVELLIDKVCADPNTELLAEVSERTARKLGWKTTIPLNADDSESTGKSHWLSPTGIDFGEEPPDFATNFAAAWVHVVQPLLDDGCDIHLISQRQTNMKKKDDLGIPGVTETIFICCYIGSEEETEVHAPTDALAVCLSFLRFKPKIYGVS